MKEINTILKPMKISLLFYFIVFICSYANVSFGYTSRESQIAGAASTIVSFIVHYDVVGAPPSSRAIAIGKPPCFPMDLRRLQDTKGTPELIHEFDQSCQISSHLIENNEVTLKTHLLPSMCERVKNEFLNFINDEVFNYKGQPGEEMVIMKQKNNPILGPSYRSLLTKLRYALICDGDLLIITINYNN